MLGEKVGAAAAAVGVVASAMVLAALVKVDVDAYMNLKSSTDAGTTVPAAGSLSGLRTLDRAEWQPMPGERNVGVLFGIGEPGEAHDLDFWLDVARRAAGSTLNLQFVGLCLTNRCGEGAVSGSDITLLAMMDPIQTHAVVMAASQGTAFIYRDAQVLGPLQMDAEPAVSADRIAKVYLRVTGQDRS